MFVKSRIADISIGVVESGDLWRRLDKPLDVDHNLDDPDEEEEENSDAGVDLSWTQDDDEFDDDDSEAKGVADPDAESNDGTGDGARVGYEGVHEEIGEEDPEEKNVSKPLRREILHYVAPAYFSLNVEFETDHRYYPCARQNGQRHHPVIVPHLAVVENRWRSLSGVLRGGRVAGVDIPGGRQMDASRRSWSETFDIGTGILKQAYCSIRSIISTSWIWKLTFQEEED